MAQLLMPIGVAVALLLLAFVLKRWMVGCPAEQASVCSLFVAVLEEQETEEMVVVVLDHLMMIDHHTT